MDFDEDGLPTPESLIFIEQIERQAARDAITQQHNKSVQSIRALGESILQHCLRTVSFDRDLLRMEGALNSSIVTFLKRAGFFVRIGDSHRSDYLHGLDDNGKAVAMKVPRERDNPKVVSDVIVERDGERIELKTASFASPKESIPSELFNKDLRHLQRHVLEDLETFPWEGLLRINREAEMAIFVCDKIIAEQSDRFCALVGDLSSSDRVVRRNHDGVTYVIETGFYTPDQQLNVQSSKPIVVEEFIVLLATPSERE
ncbi:hypothetical protein QZM66_20825 [Burkholderia contaminans]|uniref:hypothetical protein n=1 Tax=Burkholderia contaminans TaxID=488447 RepID=UPI002650755C|nr:hypothetical protein [Burkholderia contaminans]MDN7790004.1 hypothetical protein [Burkholderia contaminans]